MLRQTLFVSLFFSLAALATADDYAALIRKSGVKGGLVVHVGCGDGQGVAAACQAGPFIAHGLDADANKIEAAQAMLEQRNIDDRGSVELWKNDFLPYTDEIVNLLILENVNITRAEIMRVLAPRGKALVKKGGSWTTIEKPWPKEIDEWTHYLHGPDNNAVANDTRVAPPKHIRWLGAPKFARDHDAAASLSAMTSSNGRLFYIIDEGPTSVIHQEGKWTFVARDAFNGVILWKRPLPDWLTHLYYFRSGPVWLNRMLVSIGDHVYTSLGFEEPVKALDAATGKELYQFEKSQKTEEIICIGDQLLAVIGDPSYANRTAKDRKFYNDAFGKNPPTVPKYIVAYARSTGKMQWKIGGDSLKGLVPVSLAASGSRFVYLDGHKLHCASLRTGETIWSTPFEGYKSYVSNYTPTVVMYKGNVLCMSYDKFCGFAIEGGKAKWKQAGAVGFASPGDVFGVDDVVWTAPTTKTVAFSRNNKTLGDNKILPALDLNTGETVRSFDKNKVWSSGHHHRCYRNKATTNWVITGRSKTAFLGVNGKDYHIESYLRGVCQYGLLPCNGLLYVPPNRCKCFGYIKLDGFHALSGSASEGEAPTNRLEKGPAFGKPLTPSTADGDWPTYRHDPQRSCNAAEEVPAKPSVNWKTKIRGKLTGCVAAGGKVYLAATDRNAVYALNALDGRVVWKHVARGPVDSPPTIWNGLAIFGSCDGSATALRAEDGALVWRFFAAPTHRRIVVRGNLESPWPVHGSILVKNNKAYFSAGRTSYLDGGVRFYCLDAETGKQLYATCADSRGPKRGNTFNAQVQSDVMQSTGAAVMIRTLKLSDELTLGGRGPGGIASPIGLLDGSWMHRLPAQVGGFQKAGGKTRSIKGKLFAVGADFLWSAEAPYTILKHTKSMWPPTHEGHLHQKYSRYRKKDFPTGTWLTCYGKTAEAPPAKPAPAKPAKGKKGKKKSNRKKGGNSAIPKWRVTVPVQIRGLFASGGKVVTVGWEDEVNLKKFGPVKKPAGVLQVWDGSTGKNLSTLKLPDHPVFEGVVSANGKLYVTTKDGSVICLGE